MIAATCLPRQAQAAPTDDPWVTCLGHIARTEGIDVFLGDGEWSPPALAMKVAPLVVAWPEVHDPRYGKADRWFRSQLVPELEAYLPGVRSERLDWALRPGASLSVGGLEPVNLAGDTEPGLVSARVNGDIRAYWRRVEGAVRPDVRLDAADAIPDVDILAEEVWLGYRGDHLLVGAGRRDRWLGPGRRGSLLLSDNALVPPMATVAGQGHLPGRLGRVGNLRLETSVGVFDRDRTDVNHPGLLLMDLRWMPVPQVEIGGTRMSMFWGEGRPWPGLWELLVPLEPHVYDDPDKVRPDQNEEASLDFRVTLPLTRWFGGPVRYVEAWWQYAGEDVIGRDFGGIPYPSLAGVANLYGGEVAVGPVVATVEGARIFDDYYRWYIDHRIYQDGFTQDGRVLGHEAGTDSESLFFQVGWYPWPWAGEVWHEQVRRIGVIESMGQNVMALSTDERRWRLGARGLRMGKVGGQWSLEYAFEWVEGAGFVPGATDRSHRLAVTWRQASLSTAPETGQSF